MIRKLPGRSRRTDDGKARPAVTQSTAAPLNPERERGARRAGPRPRSSTCASGQDRRAGSMVSGRRSPGSKQVTAAGTAELDAERGGGAHRPLPVAGVGPAARIEDDEGPRLAAGDQAPLDHLAGASHGRPVDPRRGAAVAVRPQTVDLELGEPAPSATWRRWRGRSRATGRAARRQGRSSEPGRCGAARPGRPRGPNRARRCQRPERVADDQPSGHRAGRVPGSRARPRARGGAASAGRPGRSGRAGDR